MGFKGDVSSAGPLDIDERPGFPPIGEGGGRREIGPGCSCRVDGHMQVLLPIARLAGIFYLFCESADSLLNVRPAYDDLRFVHDLLHRLKIAECVDISLQGHQDIRRSEQAFEASGAYGKDSIKEAEGLLIESGAGQAVGDP